MSMTKLTTVEIKCPNCGSNQLIQGEAAETVDQVTCVACGTFFSYKAEVEKIASELRNTLVGIVRNTLK
ncbi:hypothetical protein HC248_01402 [Polaromonas vacuolata]|uniref:Uncharacterized protein n=1 Tax=Polaromonas vacuolata TaxID=37448 RepID=A0A6H2H9F6_9BURK|nr:hypothetical protein HC248_01402 [Polaromonas vacuolata]